VTAAAAPSPVTSFSLASAKVPVSSTAGVRGAFATAGDWAIAATKPVASIGKSRHPISVDGAGSRAAFQKLELQRPLASAAQNLDSRRLDVFVTRAEGIMPRDIQAIDEVYAELGNEVSKVIRAMRGSKPAVHIHSIPC
jgi:hypothetical protein